MALPFETINTRKIALAAQYGYTPDEVPAGGVDDEGLTVIASAYEREKRPSHYVSYSNDSPFVHVRWENSEQIHQARKARLDDWQETLHSLGVTDSTDGPSAS